MRFLSDADLATLRAADESTEPLPLPTQMISNGEYTPLPQTEAQREVEGRIESYAQALAPQHGMKRREFLASSAGLAAAFLAMNEVFGPVFTASRAEAATPGHADERNRALASQFIIDCQTHFVRDDYSQQMLITAARFAKKHWNPALSGVDGLTRFKFQNFVKEIFLDSDTKIALISGTPTDEAELMFLSNDQIAAARDVINGVAGSRRAMGHGIVTPGAPGWLDEVDRVLETLKPQSLKGYTIGDPVYQTKKKSNWRLDDERNVYPLYEKMLKAGVTTICVHKGLMPADYLTSWPDLWQYATVWDVGKAAQRLAADQFRHLPLGDATVYRAARPGAGPVRSYGPVRLGLRSRGHSPPVRREQCLRGARHLLRQHLCDASEARRRAARHPGPRAGSGPRDLGH